MLHTATEIVSTPSDEDTSLHSVATPDSLNRLDAELSATEDRLQETETTLGHREHAAQGDADGIKERIRELEQTLASIVDAGHPAGSALLGRLKTLILPLITKETDLGVGTRRGMVEARLSALEVREGQLAAREWQLHQALEAVLEVETRAEALAQAPVAVRPGDPEASSPQVEAEAPAAKEALEAVVVAGVAASALSGAAPAEASGANRRMSPRVSLSCEVGLNTDSNFYGGFAENLSATGIFIATYDILEEGTEVDLSYQLPDGVRIQSSAIVRWVREENPSVPQMWPGIGLEFVDLEPDAQAAVDRFVATREPLFFPG